MLGAPKICVSYHRPSFSSRRHSSISMSSTFLTTHESIRFIVAFLLAIMMALRGYRKGALSLGGAISAFFVGFISLASGYRFGASLLAFYYSATRATRYKSEQKKREEDGYSHALGKRSSFQVLASSLPATLLAFLHFLFYRGPDPLSYATPTATSLQLAVLLFFSACAGDTFASEIGSVAASGNPVLLIAPWRSVPAGTNGGVSAIGTGASALGGFVVAAFFLLFSWPRSHIFPTLLVGCLGGLIGSAFDSVLGSTLQASWYDPVTRKILKDSPRRGTDIAQRARLITGLDLLSGESINCVSALCTTALAPLFVRFYREYNALSW